jgi:hypothetical protein
MKASGAVCGAGMVDYRDAPANAGPRRNDYRGVEQPGSSSGS